MALIKYYCCIFLIVLVPRSSHAQIVISGNISDTAKEAISGAMVTYRRLNSEIISGYALSDPKGYFILQSSLPEDSVLLLVKHLGYEEKSLQIKNETQKVFIKLLPTIQSLPTVIVKFPSIYRQNDTVNYMVQAFTSKEDRVIADVIKKLPGVQMDGDKILYQGKPIQKYFINGLDLLEGRYGLANNNLPIDAVQKVQIIENNQPIKILDSLIFSDRASLNVQLKKFTTTGSANIGAGFSPFLRNVNIAPMTFNKNFQTINSVQSNNAGDDISKQLEMLATGDLLDYSNFANSGNENNKPVIFVNVQEVASPGINEKKWLDNNINMLSSNFLQKLNNGLELKGNISYINDFRKKSGITYTNLFTPDQQIDISEDIHNNYNLNDFRGNFILLKNEKSIYFKNNLQLSKQWLNSNGFVLQNNSAEIYQRRELQNISLSNRFSAVTFWGKQLVNINSYIGYKQTPQSLSVSPGQFDADLNDSIPYQRMLQDVQFNYFNTDNYVSFVKGIKSFSIMPRIGFSYQAQLLQSNVDIVTNNNVDKSLDDYFSNNLHFLSSVAYVDVVSQYKKKRIRLEITMPFRLRNYVTKDDVRNIHNTLTRFTLEPRLLALYKMGRYWEASIISGYSNQYGGINTLYNAYLITSYRSLQRFNALVSENNIFNYALGLSYSNTLKSVFSNFSYNNNLIKGNYLFRNRIDEHGFNTIEMAAVNNTQAVQSLSGNYSKYFSKMKTIFKLGGSVEWRKSDYLFSDSLDKMNTRIFNGSIEANNTSLKYLSVQYALKATFINSYLSGNLPEKVITSTHSLTLNIYPIANYSLILNGDYYQTNQKTQTNQFFTDIACRTSIPKSKIDFEFSGINLLNNNTIFRVYTSDFSIIKNYFRLRPRQFMATMRFKF